MFQILCDPSSGSTELCLTGITLSGSSQAELCTPWWWITEDPKHVGVIFNFGSFKHSYNVDFKL